MPILAALCRQKCLNLFFEKVWHRSKGEKTLFYRRTYMITQFPQTVLPTSVCSVEKHLWHV